MLTPQGFTETSASPTIKEVIVTPAIPHSIDAEEGLLGALAIDPGQMLNVGYLKPADFYLTLNAAVYQAMAELWEKHQGYDLITLTEYLESAGCLDDIGGPGIIADMINFTPTSLGASEYAAIVYDRSIRRQVINGATKAVQLAYRLDSGHTAAEVVNETVGLFSGIDATRNVSNGPKSIAKGVAALLDNMAKIEETGCVAGLQTGIKALDYILGGFQKQQFYLLAGRPGMGKSAFALQVALNLATRGKSVLYFSLEMSSEKLSERLVSNISNVPYSTFKRPGIGDQQWLDIIAASETIHRLPIMIDATPNLSVSDMRSIAQNLMARQLVDIIIVDHLGLISSTGKDEYHEVTKISHGLMAMSKQLNVPIVALSQLSRAPESRGKNNQRPIMSDLRGSGHLEQDADNVLFLYRDQVYNPDTEFPNLAEINVAKNRHGDTGVAKIFALMSTNRFVDIETRAMPL